MNEDLRTFAFLTIGEKLLEFNLDTADSLVFKL